MPKVKAKVKVEETKTKEMEVTPEYFKAHPELEGMGIVVGDIIEVDANEVETPSAPVEEATKKATTLKGATAILKNGNEYVRTYGADQKESVTEFLSKDSKYSAIEDSKVKAVDVSYKIIDAKTGVVSTNTKRFEDKEEGIRFRNSHKGTICIAVF